MDRITRDDLLATGAEQVACGSGPYYSSSKIAAAAFTRLGRGVITTVTTTAPARRRITGGLTAATVAAADEFAGISLVVGGSPIPAGAGGAVLAPRAAG